MKAIDIIDALTRMGCVEATGLIETPENESEIRAFIHTWFGGSHEYIKYDRDIKPNTKYVYSYDDRLWTTKGVAKADCIIEVEHGFAEGDSIVTLHHSTIYLYEIE